MRKRSIDPAMVRTFVEQGLSDQEIASRMGWTVGTLRVRCSRLKVSLRRCANNRTSVKRSPANVILPRATFDRLVTRAALMGVSVSSLAADLLETIDRDDLYNAVRDTTS